MILGDPYKFAFLIERIMDWEKDYWINGIMFVIINDEIYPKDVRTTTFNSEIPDILSSDSALMNPIVDVKLYGKTDSEIIAFVDDEENENYYRYLIPFHEIGDAGYSFYVISDGSDVKILIGKIENDKITLIDRLELSLKEYNQIKMQLIDFYNNNF
ncbi:MAG: immunity 42 family protein [Clostridium sp.]|nr:immunity 42 family protein [Clostridium sp.]MCM1547141.1 immunity 42 family protein [Ruminococcus sp.]